MKLATCLTLLGFGTLAGTLALQQGCSESKTESTAQSAGSAPKKPDAPKTTSTDRRVFAISKLFLGDTDRAGSASPNAWKKFGYDLDGKTSTASAEESCRQPPGGGKTADGDNGIDNAFGAKIVPTIQRLSATAAQDVNNDIASGKFTLLFDTTGLSADATQTATGLSAQLFAGMNLGSTPTWTTADKWPVDQSLLANGTVAGGSKIRFDDAFVVNGTFVSGSNGLFDLRLSVQGAQLAVTVRQAVITFQRQGAKATNGIIAGVINTQELINGVKQLADNQLGCGSGAQVEIVLNALASAADILSDGTVNPEKTCDAISVGLGFEAIEVGVPDTVAPPQASANAPCDAGAPADAATGG